MSNCGSCSGCSLKTTTSVDTNKIIYVLLETLEYSNKVVKGHSKRVGDMAKWLAQYLEIDRKMVELIRMAGYLHDIGMVTIPNDVLNQQEALTNEQKEVIKTHVNNGVKLLSNISDFDEITQIVGEHHEWFDGTGYPNGYAGNEIHLGARIIALCEAVDHMSTDHPYRKALSYDEIAKEIQKGSGTQFDPWFVMHIKELLITWQESLD